MALRFEVLGFAGAAPLQGACSSYVVSSEHATVLLDCGPGTLERLWQRGLLDRLDAIVVSHMHADHVLDLVPFAGEVVRSMLGDRRIALHVPEADGPDVLRRLDAAFARTERQTTRFEAAFDVREYRVGDRLVIGDLSFAFVATAHAQPCFATRVTDGRTVIVYGADGAPSDALAELAAGADLLVLEATFADDELSAREHGHMTAAQAGEIAARAGASTLLLTHLLAGSSGGDLVRQAGRSFSGPVQLAHEGYSFSGSSAASA
jgi:ribonuclease BN (tRNA processing enzyme)